MAITNGTAPAATGFSKSAGSTSLALTVSAAVSVGQIVLVACAVDNTATTDSNSNDVTSVTDSKGNTYSKIYEFTNGNGAALAGATIAVFKSKIATALTTSDTITFSHSSTTARGGVAASFSVGSGNDLQLAGSVQTLANDAADPGSMSVSGLTSKEYLFVRATAYENPAVAGTATASFTKWSGTTTGTNSGATATNMGSYAESQVLTGTGATSDPTVVAADCASIFFALEEYTPGGGGVTGTGSGSIAFTGSADGTNAASASATVSISFAGTSAAVVAVSGTAAQSIALGGQFAGAVAVVGASAGSMALLGSSLGAIAVSGAGQSSFGLSGVATGAVALLGASGGSFGLTGAGAASTALTGAASSILGLTGGTVGTVAVQGAANGTIDLGGNASVGSSTSGAASGFMGVGGSGAGIVPVSAVALSAFDLGGSAIAESIISGQSLSGLGFTGSGSASVAITAAANDNLGLVGSATGQVTVPATVPPNRIAAVSPVNREATAGQRPMDHHVSPVMRRVSARGSRWRG